MNKAFVREPDADASPLCPSCGTIGVAVGAELLNRYVRPDVRLRLQSGAWNCGHSGCDVIYFNQFELVIRLGELQQSAWPYDPDASVCPCFGLRYDDIVADADAAEPLRIRELIRQSRTPDARCASLAIDGQCCIREVQKLYLNLRGGV